MIKIHLLLPQLHLVMEFQKLLHIIQIEELLIEMHYTHLNQMHNKLNMLYYNKIKNNLMTKEGQK